jgi:predicted O-methyltransferase YrrM
MSLGDMKGPALVFVLVAAIGLLGEWIVPRSGAVLAVAGAASVLVWWTRRLYLASRKDIARAIACCQDAAAMPTLTALLPVDLPHSSFSLSPAAVARMLNEVAFRGHRTIVECGSGVSTLLFGAKLRQAGAGHVWSIEHDPQWADYMRRLIERVGLQDWITLVEAPLEETQIAGRPLAWYSRAALPEVLVLPRIDVLLVDGPPMATGRLNRFGALPVFDGQLHASSLVVLDDAYRRGERAVANAWKALGYSVSTWWTSHGQFEVRKRS